MLSTTRGSTEEIFLGTYYDTDLGSVAGFTDGTVYGKFDGLLCRARLELLDGLKLGIVEFSELGFCDGELLGKHYEKLPFGVYDGRELGS